MADFKDFKKAIQLLENIQEGEKIQRFKFTPSESAALTFLIEFAQKYTSDED